MTQEELDDLQEFFESPGMKLFWRFAKDAVELIEGELVKYDLRTGSPNELAHLKCRAEGAASLLQALKMRSEQIRRPNRKPSTKKS